MFTIFSSCSKVCDSTLTSRRQSGSSSQRATRRLASPSSRARLLQPLLSLSHHLCTLSPDVSSQTFFTIWVFRGAIDSIRESLGNDAERLGNSIGITIHSFDQTILCFTLLYSTLLCFASPHAPAPSPLLFLIGISVRFVKGVSQHGKWDWIGETNFSCS